ncbi:hypothetical protein POM88_033187 [Heracleum sosnowskyi]|uniref:Rx N-terminal domain-containing protein n=1 Tax=Heracleum sosnowskyi TaxID=360622 RepID=A0AAD8I207_9APIA|nr:hypothetical protein POM88_033187 [Heracleum sosnowskyi]
MAETVVSFAVERLGELLISEIKHLHGVSHKVEQIQRELERMQCFLEEADKKQNHDKRVQKWVAEIRELAFKIEDVIEIFAMEVATKNQKSGFKKMLRRFACMLCEGVSRHNISTEIDAIKDDITGLTASLQTYGITQGLQQGQTSNSAINLKSHVHKIEGLTTEEGWQLLSKKAGISDILSDEILASQMERIGKNMDMEIISELVYLKCLRLDNCSVEELPSSISNLRNLEILDIWRSQVGMFANVLWKLKHLKYLSLPVNLEVVEKLRFKGLDELEVIYRYHSDYCDTYELIGLRKLKVLSGTFNMKRDVDLCKSVLNFTKSRELRFSNLSILCGEFCLVSLLECCFTNAFHISGPICKFPREVRGVDKYKISHVPMIIGGFRRG